MLVVVVGATGNLGTALLDALAADADVTGVRAVARRPPARSWAKTAFVGADIAHDDLGPVVHGADAVVDLAWRFQPTHRPTLTWQTNVVGSIRLFDAVARQQVPVLACASSVGAYSPAPGATVDESWPTDGLPTAAYGREKAYLERALDVLESRHPEVRVVRMRPAFVFQRSAGPEQLRLFAGPLVPASLVRPGVLPMLPFPGGLRFQAVHAADVAQAFCLALHSPDARGAFNLAAEPVIDADVLASLLGARPIAVPPAVVRVALASAWHARLVPAEPALFDLAMGLPLMRTERARRELTWEPRVDATTALGETLAGMADGTGAETVPLAPDSLRRRAAEVVRHLAARP